MVNLVSCHIAFSLDQQRVGLSIDLIRKALEQGRATVNPLDDGTGVVVDIAGEQLLTLNATGVVLMQVLESGTVSEQALASALTARYEVDHDRALTDSRAFVERVSTTLS